MCGRSTPTQTHCVPNEIQRNSVYNDIEFVKNHSQKPYLSSEPNSFIRRRRAFLFVFRMEKIVVQNLIGQVSQSLQYSQKVSRLTGESFNVFRILGLETSETRTHSAFVAQLLDPKGNHGKGTVFLELFLRQTGLQEFSLNGAVVQIEKHIGFIDTQWKEGGRIDILVRNNAGQAVAIENKIYAGDQKNQLLRYHSYCSGKFKEFHLLYLTLDGREPSDLSKGTMDGPSSPIDCKHISYSDHIIEWLQACNKEVALQPIIRETIVQYINLIKYLTGQNMEDSLVDEISDSILKNGEDSLKAVFEIHKSIYNSVVSKLTDSLSKQLNLLPKNDYELTEELGTFGENQTGFYFTRSSWKFISIGFGMDRQRLFYGICRRKKSWDVEVPEGVKMKLKEALGPASGTNHWPWWEWDSHYMSTDKIYLGIYDGSFVAHIQEKFTELTERLSRIEEVL